MRVISHGAGIFEKQMDNRIEWYKMDKLHREEAPAVYYLYSKQEEWYLNGKRHRADGPAVTGKYGKKEWYLHGKQLSEQEFNAINLAKELPVNNQHIKPKKTKI